MSEIDKGIILTIEGKLDRNKNFTQARVQSKTAEGTTTLPLTIPWYLRGKMGDLKKGTEIVYALFDDATGVILSRMDGNWEGEMEETQLILNLMNTTAEVKGNINLKKLTGTNVSDSGIRLAKHEHGGVTSGESNTSYPVGGNAK